jgi:hypothetical protein
LFLGKKWDDDIKAEVKGAVGNSIVSDVVKSSNTHNRNLIDALVIGLENLIKN